jgi:histone H3/H4
MSSNEEGKDPESSIEAETTAAKDQNPNAGDATEATTTATTTAPPATDDETKGSPAQEEPETNSDEPNPPNDERKPPASPEAAPVLGRPPKRARTAYFIFADAVRSNIQKEHPGEGVAAQAKRIGARWKSIPEPERDKYKDLAAKEKAANAAALAAYQERFGSAALEDTDPSSSSASSPDDLFFPIAKIRKIAKLDPEVKTLSKEALQLVVKSAELALAKLGAESVKVARIQNRRTLLAEDVCSVCSHREVFRFLKDDLRDLAKQLANQKKENQVPSGGNNKAGTIGKAEAARAAAVSGTKPLTSYFGVAAASSTNK